MPTVTSDLKPSQQTALAGFEDLGLTLDQLPEGISDVSAKEMKFVTALLKHGQMAKAAIEAGYQGESAGAGVWASKTLRKTKVFRVYQAALANVSADADKLVTRVYERSVIWHEKAKEAAQEAANLDELLIEAFKEKKGKDHHELTEFETQRSRMLKLEKHYASLAHREDTLLGSLLGKLNLNIKIDGDVTHYTAGTEYTQQFAAQRRAWEASQGGRN